MARTPKAAGSVRVLEDRLDRLRGRLAGVFADPLWPVLHLLFLREAARRTPGVNQLGIWERLAGVDPAEIPGRLDGLFSGLRQMFPRQLDDLPAPFTCFAGAKEASPSLWREVIGQVSACELDSRWQECGPVDVLGDAYLLLLSRRAAQTRGEFYTPSPLALMMARMMVAAPGQTVLDPACGSGRLLLAALQASRERYGERAASFVWLYGIELSAGMASVARLNMVLAGAGRQATIVCGDAFKVAFADRDGQPATFDVILANPPFGNGR